MHAENLAITVEIVLRNHLSAVVAGIIEDKEAAEDMAVAADMADMVDSAVEAVAALEAEVTGTVVVTVVDMAEVDMVRQ